MVTMFFGDKSSNDTKFVAFVVFAVIAFFVLRVFIPGDILTSARFYDGMGLQVVFGGEFNGNWLGQSVSFEAASFGIILFVIQIAFGYLILMEKNDKTSRGYWALYWLFVIVDVVTDADFRSYSFTDIWMTVKGLLVSFCLYNVLSEWAAVVSFRVLKDTWTSVPIVMIGLLTDIAKVVDQMKRNAPKRDERGGMPNFGGSHKPVPNFPPMPPQQGKPSNKADMHMKMPPMAEMPMPSHEDVVQLLKRGEKQHEQ